MGRDLVAKDHRLLQPHGAEAAMLGVMQIRPADAARGQPQQHLTRLRGGGRGAILDPHILGGMDDDGFHLLGHGRLA